MRAARTIDPPEEAALYFQFAGVLMVAIDATERVTGINRLGCELLGREEREILGQNWFDHFVPERLREDVRTTFRQLMAGRVELVEYHENPVLARSGVERIVEWHNRVLRDARGKIVGTLSAGTDVTERKRLQRELIEKESLARLGEMAAVVAHEVRNPLAGISGSLRVVAEGLPPESPHQAVLEEIQTRLRTLGDTVDDLLLYARPIRRHPIRVPVSTLLEKAVADLRHDDRFGGVEIDLRTCEAILHVDPDLIIQVLLNLFQNAAQAMGGRGRIHVRVEDDGESCAIIVADEGPGVPDAVRERIFEPFFTTRARGTGLGLPTARRILEAHGGGLDLRKAEGGGAAFVVRLPRA